MLDKVDRILRILAILATKDMKQREQIAVLDKAGFQPKDIAALVGTTANTVRVALVALRRSKANRKSRRRSRNAKAE